MVVLSEPRAFHQALLWKKWRDLGLQQDFSGHTFLHDECSTGIKSGSRTDTLRGGQNPTRELGRSGMEEPRNQAQKSANARHMAKQAVNFSEKRSACHGDGIARNSRVIPDLNYENNCWTVIRRKFSEA